MAYTITNVYALDPTYTGASLRAQLYDISNAAVGSPISTGFYERAGAQGVFAHAMSVPDDHVGWCDVYDNAAPTVILVSFPINPRELEYADARVSSRAAWGAPGGVEFTYTVTDGVTPIADAALWFATDAAITNVVWFGVTDAFGVARDVNGNKPRLAPGAYYIRAQKSGYIFDVDMEAVS